MAKVHLFLQGKGGVGKSFCASMLAQYMLDHDRTPICIDTDPINATFSGYKRFQAKRIEILKDNRIDPLQFDGIIEQIFNAGEQDSIIVDNGASSFVAFSEFLLTNKVPQMLSTEKHSIVIHTIITGGDEQADTVAGFSALVTHFSEPVKIVVWLNPYYGPVEADKSFEEFKAYKLHEKRVACLVRLPDLPKDSFAINIVQMLKSRLTFAESLAKPDLPIMTRQRLKLVQEEIYSQVTEIRENL